MDSIGPGVTKSWTQLRNFHFFFPIWIPFISFSYLVTLAGISITLLNKSGENGHPYLIFLS